MDRSSLDAEEIVRRSWTDPEFRSGLPVEMRDLIPPAPSRTSELSDAELDAAAGVVVPLVAAAVTGAKAAAGTTFGRAFLGTAGATMGAGVGKKLTWD
ncbi:MAG: mersacidin/lichenicidin family type 2 lantibiotic [Solirubrobacterales bacterium]|nr:mersacidin/lichenicidin family type 2 lantibiotic [Solirubrobacterales bacterium]